MLKQWLKIALYLPRHVPLWTTLSVLVLNANTVIPPVWSLHDKWSSSSHLGVLVRLNMNNQKIIGE